MRSKMLYPTTALLILLLSGIAHADVVSDWNAVIGTAMRNANIATGSQTRPLAIMHAAMFDALNGIDRKYEPYFVTDFAPSGARQEAAAAQAAYTTLVGLIPSQKAAFDTQLALSLAAIPGAEGSSESIRRGVAWGERVALDILAWRSGDGFIAVVPPFCCGATPGVWRAVPPTAANANAVFPQVAVMTPFVMTSHSQFRPGPPPALASAEYAADVNEVKAVGRATGSTRTAEQTELARLWHAVAPADENATFNSLLPPGLDLVDRARILALVNLAMADAYIYIFDAKYTYNLWRPYHAIRLADTDGNPATSPDPDWTSLILPTPNHQEYPSAHSAISGAAFRMMRNLLGDLPFTLRSLGYPSFVYDYPSFSAAILGVQNARIWGGIHYRFATQVGASGGATIADYIFANFMQPRGNRGRGN
jgi:PAP2 superfamily protein